MQIVQGFTSAPPTNWEDAEIEQWRMPELEEVETAYKSKYSKYNPTPGSGHTGMHSVGPNNFPFYTEAEWYKPIIQADGGQLSEWQEMYAPSKEQAEEDRAKAYELNIPHGYIPPGAALQNTQMLELWVQSDLHDSDEYGQEVDPSTNCHKGGPFKITVSSKIRVEDLRIVIRDVGGIMPALQRLSFGGKHMEDAQRTLEHYGVRYWHKRFPHWPISIRRY